MKFEMIRKLKSNFFLDPFSFFMLSAFFLNQITKFYIS